MHPLGLYLAITDSQREHGWVAAPERRASLAPVDATPIAEHERVSPIARLAAFMRWHIMRTAGAAYEGVSGVARRAWPGA